MNKTVQSIAKLSGHLRVPPDKSITHRAVLFSSLADGRSRIKNPLPAEDCLSTASCVEALGCRVEKKEGEWIVEGRGLWGYKAPVGDLNCGNSGTTIRLISGILAAQPFCVRLTGDDSLCSRPMDRVSKPLEAMGAMFALRDGKYAPFEITGKKNLKARHWKNNVASAQVKSAVLLAGLHAEGETTFEEPIISRDHTERMLSACGVSVTRNGSIAGVSGPAHLSAQDWTVPGDFSSAAFLIVAALLVKNSAVVLEEVNINPTRTGLLVALQQMGAKIKLINCRDIGGEPVADIEVATSHGLRAMTLDQALVPHLVDEVPILAVAATQAEGTTVLKGIGELRVKETDRIMAMAKNLKILGARIQEEKDALVIEGPTALTGGMVDSFHDHRIAMSMAVAGLIAQNETVIVNSESVAISFPSFWQTLHALSNR